MTPLRILITGINGGIGRILHTALEDAHDLQRALQEGLAQSS